MSIKKRGNIWYIRFTDPNGKEIRCSANTEDRQTAQELEDELKRRAWRDAKLGEKLTKTWEDACLKWFEEKAEKKSIEDDRSRARWLNQHLAGYFLNDISVEVIQDLAKKKQAESSNATANRHLQLLRAMLRKAALVWNWLDKAPHIVLFPEKDRNIRWLTPEQARTLLSELPEHLRNLAVVALSCGQRRSNLLNLQWSKVDMKNRFFILEKHETKNTEAIGVPINDSAFKVFEALEGVHPTHVFTYRGEPIKQTSTRAWYKALKRAGIANFRWHDLRHTWASWLVQNGTPLYDVQEMGGWKDSKMVRKYGHLDVSHLHKHANKLPNF